MSVCVVNVLSHFVVQSISHFRTVLCQQHHGVSPPSNLLAQSKSSSASIKISACFRCLGFGATSFLHSVIVGSGRIQYHREKFKSALQFHLRCYITSSVMWCRVFGVYTLPSLFLVSRMNQVIQCCIWLSGISHKLPITSPVTSYRCLLQS